MARDDRQSGPLDFDVWKDSVSKDSRDPADPAEPVASGSSFVSGELDQLERAGAIADMRPEEWEPGRFFTPSLPSGKRIDSMTFDPDTLLESILSGIAWAGYTIAVLVFLAGSNGRRQPPNLEIWLLSVWPLLVAGVATALRMGTDNHYIADPIRRALDYRFQFFGIETRRTRFTGRDLEAIVVGCEARGFGERRRNAFFVQACPKAGRPVRVTDAVPDLYAANTDAFTLAAILGVPFGPGGDAVRYRRDDRTGRLVADFADEDRLGLRSLPTSVVTFAAVLLVVLILVLIRMQFAR